MTAVNNNLISIAPYGHNFRGALILQIVQTLQYTNLQLMGQMFTSTRPDCGTPVLRSDQRQLRCEDS